MQIIPFAEIMNIKLVTYGLNSIGLFCSIIMTHKSIYLVGLMAVGKSTVGKLLAEKLNRPFFDSDKEIEKNAGAEISWIFDVEGEEGFRDREEQVIWELTSKTGAVIATGGGVVEREQNRKRIAEKGTVIHLDCPNETLVQRVRNDRKRPLLHGSEVDQVLMRLKSRRDPFYREIADYKFMSDKQTTSALVRAIITSLDDKLLEN